MNENIPVYAIFSTNFVRGIEPKKCSEFVKDAEGIKKKKCCKHDTQKQSGKTKKRPPQKNLLLYSCISLIFVNEIGSHFFLNLFAKK